MFVADNHVKNYYLPSVILSKEIPFTDKINRH